MVTITPEARVYAVRELARRANVDPAIFTRWRIELEPTRTRVWIEADKSIEFPNASATFWREVNSGNFRVENAGWCYPPAAELARQIPGFIVPFADREISEPLFRGFDRSHAKCAVDLLSSVWLTLSRFEETLPCERDMHGRFPARQSLAFKHGFLNRPIVDEYGLALEEVLRALLRALEPPKRKLRVKLSHDIDVVGIPFQYRRTVGHLLRRRNAEALLRDVLSLFGDVAPAYLRCVTQIVELAQRYGLQSTVYWKNCPPGPFDSGYALGNPKVLRVLAELRDAGVEMGAHPGYRSFLDAEQLAEEVESIRNILEEKEIGGRQHYLRWTPATWRHWENCGLAYDSSVGFADHIGFRAGTCFPYRPWLLDLNREAHLLEIPLLVMDATVTKYMGLSPNDALAAVSDCIARCRSAGGVFALLWHNDRLLEPELRWLYEQLLTALEGTETYDWKADLHQATMQNGHKCHFENSYALSS